MIPANAITVIPGEGMMVVVVALTKREKSQQRIINGGKLFREGLGSPYVCQ